MARRRPNRSRRITLSLLVAVLATTGAAYLATFTEVFGVRTVRVEGAQSVDKNQVADFVKQSSEHRIFGLFSRSLWLANPSRIGEQTKQKFGDLAKVEVSKQWPNTLKVTVVERQQSLLWQSGGQNYLVDQQGIVFARSEPRADVVSVIDSTNLPVEVGKQVVGSGFIKVLNEIRQGMTTAGLAVTRFEIPETTFEVRAVTDQEWYVVFDTTRRVDTQIESLRQAIAGVKPREYADLRVPGRVYVK